MVRRWTDSETSALRSAIQHVRTRPFDSQLQFRRDVQYHMEHSSSIQVDNVRLANKISSLGRVEGKAAAQYIRDLFSTAGVEGENRGLSNDDISRPTVSPLSEQADDSGDPTSFSGAENSAEGRSEVREETPEEHPRKLLKLNYPQKHTRIDVETMFQEYLRPKRNEQPPLHETIKDDMKGIIRDLAAGIDAFTVYCSVLHVSTNKLNSEALALSGSILPHTTQSELAGDLDNLFNGPGMSANIAMRTYGAAALSMWIFQEFDQFLDKEKQTWLAVLKKMRSYNDFEIQTRTMWERVEYVAWLKEEIKPTLLGHAATYRERLFEVFKSLSVTQSLPAHDVAGGPTNNMKTYADRSSYKNLWKQNVEAAFHAALELKLSLELTSNKYRFDYPGLGEEFNEELMSVAHLERGPIPPESKVYVCLQPGITSVGRGNLHDDPITIAKAVVMVEGYGVQPLF